jgi:hypothetical protein
MGLVAVDGEDRPKSEVKIHRAFAMRGPPNSLTGNSIQGQYQPMLKLQQGERYFDAIVTHRKLQQGGMNINNYIGVHEFYLRNSNCKRN